MNLETIFYAFLGGIVPALLWLDFWLHEDKKNPEPKGLIARTFLFGMLAVVFVLPFQKGVEMFFPGVTISAIILWAILEEIFKYGAAFLGGLRSKEDNEPVDPLIYMLTAALGFVALENTLFILGPLIGADFATGFITGNLRFIGASLLHIVSSGIVGAALSFSFYKPKTIQVRYLRKALLMAIAFHSIFNVFILKLGGGGTIIAFVSVWIGAVFLMWAFERVKRIAPNR